MTDHTTKPRIIASKVFVSIARENCSATQKDVKTLKTSAAQVQSKPGDNDAINEWGEAHNRILKQASISVIFAAAALEAYIYDYGARNMTNCFMKKYLDKLTLVQKWVVVPQVVKGKPFPRDSQGMEHLKTLISDRNELTHFKSGVDKDTLSPEKLAEKAQNAVHAIDALIDDMKSFDPNELPELQLS